MSNFAIPAIRRLVIIGHNGFIGARLCHLLSQQHPNLEIVGLSLPSFDLTLSAAVGQLVDVLGRADVLVVLAGIKKQQGDSLEIFQRNMDMASSVCRALAKRPVRRILFFSSAEVYGEATDHMAITERTPVRPTSYYGVAKFASEGLFRKAAAAGGTSLAILRPPVVYGPGDPSASYGPSEFARAGVRGEPITLWGDGLERREFLYVNDLVEATRCLIFSEANGVVNVCSGRSAAFRDVLDALSRVLGQSLAVTSRPRTRPKVDQGYRNDRLMSLFPDLCFTPLDQALRDLVEAERASVASARVS